MPRVHFIPLHLSADARRDDTILDAARRSGAPIGNSCGGIGICGRCLVRIVNGAENLTRLTNIERKTVEERGLPSTDRLACQAVILGVCSVTTSYWGSTDLSKP